MFIYDKVTEVDIKPCECGGGEPEFVIPDCHYTDCWLQCKKCGRRTNNTGGYHYAEEIPLYNARLKAIKDWNAGKTFIGELYKMPWGRSYD